MKWNQQRNGSSMNRGSSIANNPCIVLLFLIIFSSTSLAQSAAKPTSEGETKVQPKNVSSQQSKALQKVNSPFGLGLLYHPNLNKVDEVKGLTVQSNNVVRVNDLEESKYSFMLHYNLLSGRHSPYLGMIIGNQKFFGGFSLGWVYTGKSGLGIGLGYSLRKSVRYLNDGPVSSNSVIQKDDFDSYSIVLTFQFDRRK